MSQAQTETTVVLPQWNIAHIITRLELGGAQQATLSQVQALATAERPVYLLYGPGEQLDAALANMPHVRGLPIPALGRQVRPLSDGAAVWQVRRALQHIQVQAPQRPLLVHTHSSKAGIVGRIAAAMVDAACVVHSIHGFGHQPSMPRWQRGPLWAAELMASYLTDGFTADSAANLKRGRQEGLLRRHPTAVVHCGIDIDRYQAPSADALAALRQELQLTPTQPVVLKIACLKPQKDPTAFVAVAELCN